MGSTPTEMKFNTKIHRVVIMRSLVSNVDPDGVCVYICSTFFHLIMEVGRNEFTCFPCCILPLVFVCLNLKMEMGPSPLFTLYYHMRGDGIGSDVSS